jgi:hypothetical protein
MPCSILSQTKMELTMLKKIITVLVVPLMAASIAQAAAASEHHHTRTKARALAIEQLRNSNAYAAPRDVAMQPDWSNYSEGAMTSGFAGH